MDALTGVPLASASMRIPSRLAGIRGVASALPLMFCARLAWRAFVALVAAALLLPPSAAISSQGADAQSGNTRPKIGLVLSGGGARGLAHIGVLRVLEALHVPVDIVVGTSFGAIVGGAYAGGADVADIERIVRATDWSRVLQDRVSREELSRRRREDDALVSSRLEFALDGLSMQLPRGAFSSIEVERLLRLLTPSASLVNVDRLPLSYRAVATDMLTGEMVVRSDLPLFTAMRASMSVPGAFAPIAVEGRVLGDGGLVSNLPVQVARDLGADVIIAVNLGTPLGGPEALATAPGLAQQMINILTEQNTQRSLRELTPRDTLITPDLAGVSFLGFDQIERTIAAGTAAARAVADRLAPWSVTATEYVAYRERRTEAAMALLARPPKATTVRVGTPEGAVSPSWASVTPRIKPGDELTSVAINTATAEVARALDAERVDLHVTGEGPGRDVVLLPVVAPMGIARLRLGMDLETDFGITNRFTASGLYTLGGLNDRGDELRVLLRAGAVNEAQAELHQPFSRGAPQFVSVRLGYRNEQTLNYADNSLEVDSLIRVARSTAAVALGSQFFSHGQVRVGVQYRNLRLRFAIPQFAQPFSSRSTSLFGEIHFDTLDSIGFPTRGNLLSIGYEGWTNVELGPGKLVDGSSSRFDLLHASSRGAWAGHAYVAGQIRKDGLTFPMILGGFLRLSGTPSDAVVGDRLIFGRAVLARQIGALPAAIGGKVRMGGSLEVARANDADFALSRRPLYAGSLFTQVDTRFGPIYFAVGHTHGVGTAAYLFLGSVLLPSGLLR